LSARTGHGIHEILQHLVILLLERRCDHSDDITETNPDVPQESLWNDVTLGVLFCMGRTEVRAVRKTDNCFCLKVSLLSCWKVKLHVCYSRSSNPVCQTVLSPSTVSLSLHACPHISSADSFMTRRIRIRPGQDRRSVLKSLCLFSLFIPPHPSPPPPSPPRKQV
jgi:hypothetical protein